MATKTKKTKRVASFKQIVANQKSGAKRTKAAATATARKQSKPVNVEAKKAILATGVMAVLKGADVKATAKKMTAAVKALPKPEGDGLGVPAFLDRSKNGIKPAQGKAPVVGKTTMPLQGKAALAAISGAPKGKAKGLTTVISAEPEPATKSAEKLMALLGRGKAAAAKAVEVNGKTISGGKVVQMQPAPVPPGTQLTTRTIRVGMKVRLRRMSGEGLEPKVYTIIPDNDLPVGYYAYTEEMAAHIDDLVAA